MTKNIFENGRPPQIVLKWKMISNVLNMKDNPNLYLNGRQPQPKKEPKTFRGTHDGCDTTLCKLVHFSCLFLLVGHTIIMKILPCKKLHKNMENDKSLSKLDLKHRGERKYKNHTGCLCKCLVEK
jgi:hypothetical protein